MFFSQNALAFNRRLIAFESSIWVECHLRRSHANNSILAGDSCL